MFLDNEPDDRFYFLDRQPPAPVASVADTLLDHAYGLKVELIRSPANKKGKRHVAVSFELHGELPADDDDTVRVLADLLRRFSRPEREGGAE